MVNKVPKRISILAEDSVAELPELQALAEKGHEVVKFSEFGQGLLQADLEHYDLILSKSACAYLPGMEKFLADMVRGARSRRYGAAKGLATEV